MAATFDSFTSRLFQSYCTLECPLSPSRTTARGPHPAHKSPQAAGMRLHTSSTSACQQPQGEDPALISGAQFVQACMDLNMVQPKGPATTHVLQAVHKKHKSVRSPGLSYAEFCRALEEAADLAGLQLQEIMCYEEGLRYSNTFTSKEATSPPEPGRDGGAGGASSPKGKPSSGPLPSRTVSQGVGNQQAGSSPGRISPTREISSGQVGSSHPSAQSSAFAPSTTELKTASHGSGGPGTLLPQIQREAGLPSPPLIGHVGMTRQIHMAMARTTGMPAAAAAASAATDACVAVKGKREYDRMLDRLAEHHVEKEVQKGNASIKKALDSLGDRIEAVAASQQGDQRSLETRLIWIEATQDQASTSLLQHDKALARLSSRLEAAEAANGRQEAGLAAASKRAASAEAAVSALTMGMAALEARLGEASAAAASQDVLVSHLASQLDAALIADLKQDAAMKSAFAQADENKAASARIRAITVILQERLVHADVRSSAQERSTAELGLQLEQVMAENTKLEGRLQVMQVQANKDGKVAAAAQVAAAALGEAEKARVTGDAWTAAALQRSADEVAAIAAKMTKEHTWHAAVAQLLDWMNERCRSLECAALKSVGGAGTADNNDQEQARQLKVLEMSVSQGNSMTREEANAWMHGTHPGAGAAAAHAPGVAKAKD